MGRYLLTSEPDQGSLDRRRTPRRLVFNVAAEVTASELDFPLACTVRDLSEGGARLEIDRENPSADVSLPKQVRVFFCTEGTSADCRVAWQDGRHFGVEFLS